MSMHREQNFGICKFVNYKSSTPEKAALLDSYINQLSRTDSRYMISNYISAGNAKRDIEVIEKRWNPRGTRSFKQGIISFGKTVQEFPPERAIKAMNEVLQFFSEYPWLAAIHTNKPKRLHSHFLLVTTNVHTGKKFSQSKGDLRKFKSHYNSVCKRYNLPLIPISGISLSVDNNEEVKKYKILPSEYKSLTVSDNKSNYNSNKVPDLYFDRYEADIVPYFETTLSSTNKGEAQINAEQNPLQAVMEAYREDYRAFFTLGFQTGGDCND